MPIDCLVSALHAARHGRLEILDRMDQLAPISAAAASPRLKPSAPRAEVVIYDPERRRLLLGPGGEMMRYVETTYQCQVDTREEGRAYIFGANAAMVAEARDLVQDLVGMVSVGSEFLCEVLDIKDFGLMVKLNRAQEALLHMSELTHDLGLLRRPLGELVQVGQRLRCVVITVEKGTGMVRVSRKRLMEAAAGADGLVDVPPPVEGGEGRIRPIGDKPVFPVVPPRKWSKEYFRHNISGEGDMNPKVKPIFPLPSAAQGSKGSTGGSGEAGRPREGGSSPPAHASRSSGPDRGSDRSDRADRGGSSTSRSGDRPASREYDRGGSREAYRGREGSRDNNREGSRDRARGERGERGEKERRSPADSKDRAPRPRPASRDAAPKPIDLASIVTLLDAAPAEAPPGRPPKTDEGSDKGDKEDKGDDKGDDKEAEGPRPRRRTMRERGQGSSKTSSSARRAPPASSADAASDPVSAPETATPEAAKKPVEEVWTP